MLQFFKYKFQEQLRNITYDIEAGTMYYDQAIINTSLEALIALVMSNRDGKQQWR